MRAHRFYSQAQSALTVAMQSEAEDSGLVLGSATGRSRAEGVRFELTIRQSGAVLVDGQRSALQPVLSQREQWQRILNGMERQGAIDEEKIPAPNTDKQNDNANKIS